MADKPCTDLSRIAAIAVANFADNEQFRHYLMHYPGDLDTLVIDLNAEIEPLIDCTNCGNCCRSLMINVTKEEAAQLADQLGSPIEAVKKRYLEESQGGQLVINTIPCHFLTDNRCSIYTNRFSDCRAFPNLDKPGIRSRLFGTLMHYGRCPIVYNVIEEMKLRTNFIPANNA